MNNTLITWNSLFADNDSKPSYTVFKQKFVDSLVPDTPDMEKLFYLISRIRGGREFKWTNSNTIVGSIELILLDLYQQFIYVKSFYTAHVDSNSLFATSQFNKTFGLSSAEGLNLDSELSADSSNKNTTASTQTKQIKDGITQANELKQLTNLYLGMVKTFSKMFNPFIKTYLGGTVEHHN